MRDGPVIRSRYSRAEYSRCAVQVRFRCFLFVCCCFFSVRIDPFCDEYSVKAFDPLQNAECGASPAHLIITDLGRRCLCAARRDGRADAVVKRRHEAKAFPAVLVSFNKGSITCATAARIGLPIFLVHRFTPVSVVS